jgi:aspartyl-tRNA(Asn)/glutamyl-tRNA(Gln) amidotransferase subunit C
MSAEIDVGYVAELARLELNESEKSRFQADMENILQYIEQLNELDVSGIEPTAHAAPFFNVLREDNARDSFPRDEMLKNAPELIDDELIKVPQVLPGEGMS